MTSGHQGTWFSWRKVLGANLALGVLIDTPVIFAIVAHGMTPINVVFLIDCFADMIRSDNFRNATHRCLQYCGDKAKAIREALCAFTLPKLQATYNKATMLYETISPTILRWCQAMKHFSPAISRYIFTRVVPTAHFRLDVTGMGNSKIEVFGDGNRQVVTLIHQDGNRERRTEYSGEKLKGTWSVGGMTVSLR
ncbi:uncharacterized protein KY384_003454 [Bacidia gigantensis]|uniref:uncharacterized protein n=1 Tax=Bacidia gigantensis TaxID=2732470 RepID=UPI001D056261|nr:uncharacterized protein KY384_003454 [Bacidia gigantensis]KAG8531818.1 hypothetical protein KY384_003454 [Bacidia gigantensis]